MKDLEVIFRRRLDFLFYLFVIFVVLVVLRLVKVQIFDHNYYASISNVQYFTKITLPAKRGLIFDREGRILVTNHIISDIAADPFYLKKIGADVDKIAENLVKIFGGEKRYYIEKLKESKKRFVWLVRNATSEEIAKFDEFINALKTRREREIYRGLIKIEKFKRYYPYDKLASHVLGVVNTDGKALMGIELEFDEILKGKDGYMKLTRNALGDIKAAGGVEKVEPIDGYSLELTIDVGVQTIIEEELERAVKEFEAKSGVVIVVDPWTGDILGLANYPNFDANNYWLFDSESFKNRAIVDAFEPGSTFKIVPSSLLLEKDPTKLYSKVDAEGGESVIRGVKVVDFKPNKVLSFEEVLKYSSNIGIAKLGLELDKVEFYRHIKNFGFGTYTGILLPAEERGEVKVPDQWSPATKIYLSFGYELRATPLQITMAYASIANGGILIQPRLVQKVLDSEGKIVKSFPVIKVRRVISERTTEILKNILEKVVNEGTGIQARVDGLRVAGKTGTAQIYEFGFYSKTHYRASFVGFFPVDKPKYVCFVMLESPKKNYAGGVVAAPVFKRIAEQLSKISLISVESEEKSYVLNKTQGSPYKERKDDDVKKTMDNRLMPNLKNLSVRSALEKVSALDMKVNIVGSGIVVDQVPKPGTKIKPGTECTLYCRDDLK
ncbi:MAG: penicillin-binding protein [Candidatus Kryptonium sp.]|nr:penicillin-binding protein [Candidatus Kryptonium sp.]